MFPFDSPGETLQAMLIPVIIILYAIILVKLRPKEKSESRSGSFLPKTERYLSKTKTVRNSSSTNDSVIIVNSQQTSDIQVRKSAKQVTGENLHDTQVKLEPLALPNEKTQEEKRKKSFFLFGEQDFNGCHHNLGHLSTVARNSPIPEECFGCPELLECVKTNSSK
jgi:hypothetical protein